MARGGEGAAGRGAAEARRRVRQRGGGPAPAEACWAWGGRQPHVRGVQVVAGHGRVRRDLRGARAQGTRAAAPACEVRARWPDSRHDAERCSGATRSSCKQPALLGLIRAAAVPSPELLSAGEASAPCSARRPAAPGSRRWPLRRRRRRAASRGRTTSGGAAGVLIDSAPNRAGVRCPHPHHPPSVSVTILCAVCSSAPRRQAPVPHTAGVGGGGMEASRRPSALPRLFGGSA